MPEPEELLARVAHRGPDGQGYFAPIDGVILGHTRLAIQDAAGDSSAQPFTAGHVVITYNGELWNADEINVGERDTAGDTEVVAKVIEQRGMAGLNEFDGMWAVAWWDDLAQRVFLARDHLGKIPLYYRETDSGVEWASEYGALSRGPGARAVPPGGLVTIDPATGSVAVGKYAQGERKVLEATPENVLDCLRRGVRERLVGDRPIAFMLSGGLDSTTILALAREFYQGDMVAYTARPAEASDDLRAARVVADHFGVELVEVPVPVVTPAVIEAAVRAVEVPMKAQVEIALAHLPLAQAMSSDGFAVCLSGEAADELFGGYGGLQIKASQTDDDGYRAIKRGAVAKMARGNFGRVNKVGMRYGVETRLPFVQTGLVELAVAATKAASPPGKALLKEAVAELVPREIIRRKKDTFQGGSGIPGPCAAIAGGNPTSYYNEIARRLFGHLPKD